MKKARSTEYHRKAYDLPSTTGLIEYLHATAGAPTKQTWLTAIKAGNFRSWPGLASTNVTRYCPADAEATIMGHMTKNPKGIWSTRTAITDAACDAAYEAACAAIYTTQSEYDIAYAAAFEPQVCKEVHIFDIALETLSADDCG